MRGVPLPACPGIGRGLEVSDLVFDALAHAGVDARQRTRCRIVPTASNVYVRCNSSPHREICIVLLAGLDAPWLQTNICPDAGKSCAALRIVDNTYIGHASSSLPKISSGPSAELSPHHQNAESRPELTFR